MEPMSLTGGAAPAVSHLRGTLESVDLLFSGGELAQALQTTQAALLKDVEDWDPDQLLAQSEHEIAAYLADKHSVRCPELKREEMYADEPTDGRRLISDRFHGRDIEVAVSSLQVHVPYEGEKSFFSLRPDRFTLNPPRARVSASDLLFVFEDRQLDGEKLKAALDRELASIEDYLEASNEMAARHNESVLGTALAAIRRRKERLLADRKTVAGIGIPVRRRGDPPSVAVSVEARKPRIERPNAGVERYEPEWTLSDSDYEVAVAIITNSGQQMERSPSTALKLNEEERRDVMLMALNSAFEGQAGAEVFNGSGKTDILLRVQNRSVFIAECKIWNGQKNFRKAIDQLLGYLVWRDTKAALVLFIQTAAATETIHRALEVLTNHPSCLLTLPSTNTADRSDFVFKSLGDDARQIRLAFLPVVITGGLDAGLPD